MNFSLLIVLPVFFFALAFGAPLDDSSRVINGTQAAEGEFPFFASVYYNDSYVCGGFIYNQRWIVTVASCVVGKNDTLFRVTVGQISLTQLEAHEQSVRARPVPHPEYQPGTGLNDIALLQTQALVFDDYVTSINYDEVNPGIPDGVFMGFGSLIPAEQPFTRLLKTNLLFAQNCSWFDSFQFGNMICAGVGSSEGSAPCHYDEGGPIIQYGPNGPVAKGILSRHLGCLPDIPAVFTRLSTYYDFIQANAGAPYTTTAQPFF